MSETITHSVSARADVWRRLAKKSGQSVQLYLGLGRSEPGVVDLTNVFVHIDTELYDSDLLDRLQEITTTLRGKVGTRIDELRTTLLEEAATDPEGVLDAIRRGQAW